MQSENRLKILLVSAEVAPFAKTGGLADVAGSLPQALAAMGNDVRIAMPKYGMIDHPMSYAADFSVWMNGRSETCIVRESAVEFAADRENKKVPVYFLDNHHYYDREGIYCYFDDAERFAFLCKAVVEMLPRIDFQPDIIHCNDWQTGPICMLLKEGYHNKPFYKNISTVFTVHNLQYQGNFPGHVVNMFGVDAGQVFTPEKVEFYGQFSFMKAGLVYADVINTVSKTYAKEIQTPEYGEHLEGLLRKRSDDLYGIVNGISYDECDPETDPCIYKNFGVHYLEGKAENKSSLQKELNLPVRDVPLISLISRLVDQKGLDIIGESMDELLRSDVQFVLLGMGDPYYENMFRELEKKYPEKVRVKIEFNTILAQRIYAGSDMFLMPSRFEPCGLGQIFSLRYGTIPIVRATGGLEDTIEDFDVKTGKGNGFKFTAYSAGELLNTVNRTIQIYRNRPETWTMLVKRALQQDFSWDRSAEEYVELYHAAMEKRLQKAG